MPLFRLMSVVPFAVGAEQYGEVFEGEGHELVACCGFPVSLVDDDGDFCVCVAAFGFGFPDPCAEVESGVVFALDGDGFSEDGDDAGDVSFVACPVEGHASYAVVSEPVSEEPGDEGFERCPFLLLLAHAVSFGYERRAATRYRIAALRVGWVRCHPASGNMPSKSRLTAVRTSAALRSSMWRRAHGSVTFSVRSTP